MLEPVAPDPFVKMVRRDRTVHSTTSRVWFGHEVIEILNKYGVEVTRVCQIEHAQVIRQGCATLSKPHKPHYVKSRHAAKFLIYARERGLVGMLGAVIRSAAL